MNYSTLSSSSSTTTTDDPHTTSSSSPGGIHFIATHTEQVEWVGGLSRPGMTKDRYIETNLKTNTTVTATTTSLPSNNDIVKPLHERLAEARAKAEEEFDDGTDRSKNKNYSSLPRGLDEEDIAYLDEQRSIHERTMLSAYDQEQQDKLEFLQQQERLQKEQERLEQERIHQKLIGGVTNISAHTKPTHVPLNLAAKIIVKNNSSAHSSSSSSSSSLSGTTSSSSPTVSVSQPSTIDKSSIHHTNPSGKRSRSEDNEEQNILRNDISNGRNTVSTLDHPDKRIHTTISVVVPSSSSSSSSLVTKVTFPTPTPLSSSNDSSTVSVSSLPRPVFAKKLTTDTILPLITEKKPVTNTAATTVITGGLVDYDTSSSSNE